MYGTRTAHCVNVPWRKHHTVRPTQVKFLPTPTPHRRGQLGYVLLVWAEAVSTETVDCWCLSFTCHHFWHRTAIAMIVALSPNVSPAPRRPHSVIGGVLIQYSTAARIQKRNRNRDSGSSRNRLTMHSPPHRIQRKSGECDPRLWLGASITTAQVALPSLLRKTS